MPAKNSVKQYVEDSYYHIYNRGVEKRLIFLDEQDYAVFLSYLKEYLLPKNAEELSKRLLDSYISPREKDRILKLLRINNFAEEITLQAYCLMPNHFHLFVKQKSALSINKFMQSLCTRYTMYFNHKYTRVGCLFQAVYKAVLVEREDQYLHLSRYIHKQALALPSRIWEGWAGQPCSYLEYLGKRRTEWVHPEDILSYFSTTNHKLSYEAFVAEDEDFTILHNLTLED